MKFTLEMGIPDGEAESNIAAARLLRLIAETLEREAAFDFSSSSISPDSWRPVAVWQWSPGEIASWLERREAGESGE